MFVFLSYTEGASDPNGARPHQKNTESERAPGLSGYKSGVPHDQTLPEQT